jgi:molybdopterin-containing oxidoreductase family iron-sulfur binding subunit
MTAPVRPFRGDMSELGARLAGKRGRAYWRSLEELAETPSFLALLEEELPRYAALCAGAFDRRRFLQLMAASLALGGLAGCGPEPAPRELLPYVEAPVGVVPGRARYYATATTFDGYATGVLLEHQMARPIKVEGNPDHPASLGASSAIMQATILDLWDPHRAQTITENGQITTWGAFVTTLIERRRALAAKQGEGLRLLTGAVTSPSFAARIDRLRRVFPALQWHRWEAIHRDTEREAAQLAFGRPLDGVLDLEKADVILSVGGDFLSAAPGHLAYARAFAARRRAAEVQDRMSRLYAIESTPTLAGAKADHRQALRPDEIAAAMRYLAGAVGAGPKEWTHQSLAQAKWLDALARDLTRHHGAALVHAGREQPAEVHALVHAVNDAVGAIGQTIRFIEPVEVEPTNNVQSITALTQDLNAGKVDTLLILGTNAVYTAPADLGFTEALARAPLSMYLGAYADETALACRWHIPARHEYENWSDARAFDGTETVMQPQIRPLYGGRSALELLGVLLGETEPDDYAFLRGRWKDVAAGRGAGDFETFWHEALRVGVVPDSAAASAAVRVRQDLAASLPSPKPAPGGLSILFRPDEALWDGRYAGNGWLEELPRTFTRLTWDNVAMVAPETAGKMNLTTGDVAELEVSGRRQRVPIWVLPGQAADCVTLPLGFGRRAGSPVAVGVGFDAYVARRSGAQWVAAGGALHKADETVPLATVQHHDMVAGRDLIREGSLADFLKDPDFLKHHETDESLYPGYHYVGYAWSMAINLNSCIGCQACVAACQAENNIPVVGKDQVLAGREMHWLRIDRYYSGPPDAPETHFEPMPCMHCENAPCEVVCPVHATVHDSEGLNVMVYNRCVGTRFCSNNCPYKVRRFNFFSYTTREDRLAESWTPEVTVRDRGVMEKCSYCIQRVRAAQIDADRENRAVRDGEIVTACQQACPTQAIVFGDKNDRESAVSKRKASPLDYTLLAELNTRPRTSYEAEIRNPNPEIGPKVGDEKA